MKSRLLCASIIKASQDLDKAIIDYMDKPNRESLKYLMERRLKLHRLIERRRDGEGGQVCEGK
jgi:hypothetical protein